MAEGSWDPQLRTCVEFSLPAPVRWKCPELGNSAESLRRRYDLWRGSKVEKGMLWRGEPRGAQELRSRSAWNEASLASPGHPGAQDEVCGRLGGRSLTR